MAGVMAIFAHPDDESLLAGGTLAACSAAGVDVRVVSMTRGEAGPIGAPEAIVAGELGAVRERELHEAARALGACEAECLGYPDGELDGIDWDAATALLADRIGRWRPSALITFGAEGLYWHPDHLAVHELAWAAIALRGARWVYEATWPQALMAQLVGAMASSGLATGLWGIDPDAFGAPPGTITAALDVRPFLDRKLRALRSHASQLAADHLLAAVPRHLAEEFLGREYFVRARPPVTSCDWLTSVVAAARLGRGVTQAGS